MNKIKELKEKFCISYTDMAEIVGMNKRNLGIIARKEILSEKDLLLYNKIVNHYQDKGVYLFEVNELGDKRYDEILNKLNKIFTILKKDIFEEYGSNNEELTNLFSTVEEEIEGLK